MSSHDCFGVSESICFSDENPCMNGGRCSPQYDRSDSYGCSCQHGYSGNNCQTGISLDSSIY